MLLFNYTGLRLLPFVSVEYCRQLRTAFVANSTYSISSLFESTLVVVVVRFLPCAASSSMDTDRLIAGSAVYLP